MTAKTSHKIKEHLCLVQQTAWHALVMLVAKLLQQVQAVFRVPLLPEALVSCKPRHDSANLVEPLLCHEPARHHEMQHVTVAETVSELLATTETKCNAVDPGAAIPTMNLIRFPTPTVSPTAMAPPLGSMPMMPLMRKSFASSCDSSLKSSGATARVRLLLTSSLHTHTHIPHNLMLLC